MNGTFCGWECDQRETSNGRSFVLLILLSIIHRSNWCEKEEVFKSVPAVQFQADIADIPSWSQSTTHLYVFSGAASHGSYTLWSTQVFDTLLISQCISTVLSYVIYICSHYFLSKIKYSIKNVLWLGGDQWLLWWINFSAFRITTLLYIIIVK